MTQAISASRLSNWRFSLAILLPALAVTWSYWTTLQELSLRWSNDPQYSHGYLVPFFALALLWIRRRQCIEDRASPSWWGLPLLVFGITLRLIGTHYYFVWLDPLSLVPCLAGACLMMGGRSVWRWAWPSIVFLFFMIPLPFRLATAMSSPLQNLATITSTFALQTLGFPALAEGTTILLDDKQIGIVEACSGLRMLVVFFALSTGVALVIERRRWEKVLIILSAIPIALISNVLRITITGVLLQTTSSEVAEKFFHDMAGWFMMPLALGLLALELKLLSRLLLEPAVVGPSRFGLETVQLAPPGIRKRQPWKKPAPTTKNQPGRVAAPAVQVESTLPR
jgi:exosortase